MGALSDKKRARGHHKIKKLSDKTKGQGLSDKNGAKKTDKKKAENDKDKFLENNIDFFCPTCAISSPIYLPLQTQYLEYL